MELFSGIQYLMIDIANNSGKSAIHKDSNGKPLTLDKLQYTERLEWFNEVIYKAPIVWKKATDSEIIEFIDNSLIEPDRPLAFVGLKAYIDYLNGEETGHMVAFDASASGIQLMSALTADERGLYFTGVVGNKRSDIYSVAFDRFKEVVGSSVTKERDDIKKAIMTFYYGSKKKPKEVLGEAGLPAFHHVMQEMCNGAFHLRDVLINSWNPESDNHTWSNADGHISYIPVIVEKKYKFYMYGNEIPFKVKTKGKTDTGLSNAANIIHAVDALIVREMVRRCKFGAYTAQVKLDLFKKCTEEKDLFQIDLTTVNKQLVRMVYLWKQTNFPTVRICNYVETVDDVSYIPMEYRNKLISILEKLTKQPRIELITIHDSFKCHMNYMNYIRFWYKEMIADLVESKILQFTVNQLTPNPFQFHHDAKWRKILADRVRADGNYAIT